MTSFADLKSNIADDLNRSDLTTQINRYVLRAVAHYAKMDFWFNEAQATAATVAAQEFYALPTDFQAPKRMQLSDGTTKEWLVRRANQWMDANFETATQGRPTYWAVLASQFRLRDIPDAVYTMTLTYRKELTALSADADTNAWTEDAEMLIHHRSAALVAAFVMRDEPRANLHRMAETDELRQLRQQNTAILSAGTLATEIGVSRPFDITYG
jgi:hypothetical protein